MIRFGCIKQVGDFEILGVLCSGRITFDDSLTGEIISNEPFIVVRENGIDCWECRIRLNEDSVEDFISQIEKGEGKIETEGEENIKIYEAEELIHEIRNVFQRLSSIRLEKKQDCLVVDGHDLKDASTRGGKDYNEKRIISKNDSLTRVIIFGNLCISTELVLENAVDFRELMEDKYKESVYPCHACQSLERYMQRVDTDYTHGNIYYVCDECLKEITLKCAEISGNKKVKNEIIATSI